MDCLFCKIAERKLSSEIIDEDELFVVFKDINPRAPIHLLLIPKKHLESVNRLDEQDRELVGKLIFKAKKVAEKIGVAQNGYRLIFNIGSDAGMALDHLHLHLLAGRPLKFEF